MFDLTGMTALVTGASGGIGSAIAKGLAAQGARLAVSGSNAEKLEAFRAELGGDHVALPCNLSDGAAVDALVPQAVEALGKLDILVNNAAIAVQGKTVDDPELDVVNLDRQWQTNVLGPVSVTRAAAPVLSDGGRILFIGSLFGTRVLVPGVADYAGTKAALIGYAKGVARDLGRRNITVNVVQPGVMPTDMSVEALGDTVPDALLDLHPIRRIATLEEVSALICHLAGPHGGYMSGGVIDVAGGLGI